MKSVAMAFYNGKKYIKEQVNSILDNLEINDELIISIDDDSDGSKEILEKLALEDPRIRLVKGPGKGVVKNFQNAIRECRGEIIFLADQDDVWKDHKVARIEKIFEDPKVTAVVHNAEIVDGALHPVGQTTFQWRNSGTGFFKNIKEFLYWVLYGGAQKCIRQDFADSGKCLDSRSMDRAIGGKARQRNILRRHIAFISET